MAKIERERFAVSLGLVGWLALRLHDRPDSLDVEVRDGLGCVPDVNARYLSVTRIPDDRGDQCLRWIGRVAEAFLPATSWTEGQVTRGVDPNVPSG
jgi:hypothetical protein